MKKFTLLLVLFAFAALSTLQAQTHWVDFDIVNAGYTGTAGTDQAFEFDVRMKADHNDSYHALGQVYMNYNTGLFGVSVVANGKLGFNHEALLNEILAPGFPKYQDVNGGVDNTGSRFALTWETRYPEFSSSYLGIPGLITHTEVKDFYKKLYHIKLDIPLANQNAGLVVADAGVSFEFPQMYDQIFMIDTTCVIPSPNNSNVTCFVQYGNGFLPVEMLSFEASKIGEDNVFLRWVTATELNNDYFVIEKKRGEGGEFVALGQISGVGTTEQETAYDFTDDTKMAAINYYRLKQVDFDGTSVYTDVIAVNFEIDEQDRFTAYPTYAQDIVRLRANTDLDSDHQYSVFDLTGSVILSGSIQRDAAEDKAIAVTSLAPGVYFIKINNALGRTYTSRFIKVN